MENVFTREYRVLFHEADFRGIARPVAILGYLQDAAASHSAVFGHTVADLRARNMTWVLSRYHVRLGRYPRVGESVSVTTWRSGIEGTFVLREFQVSDGNGREMAAATSSWAVLNLETRRPVRPDAVVAGLRVLARRALDDEFPPLKRLEGDAREIPFRVRLADLDLNRHVNHTVYVEWALETAPYETLQGFLPWEIEVGYRAEAFYGDRVISRIAAAQGTPHPVFLHQLAAEGDGRELTRLRTAWREVGSFLE